MTSFARRRLITRARTELARWRRTLDVRQRGTLRVESWRDAPLTLEAMPIDRELDAEHQVWSTELAEYIAAHDINFFFFVDKVFHICRAHPAARSVIATGVIPGPFTCPRAAPTCPFAAASACAGNQPLRLTLRRQPGSQPGAASSNPSKVKAGETVQPTSV